MVKLCTFGQMANCLERGGAAYRFGRSFPIYFGNGGVLYEYHQQDYMSYRAANIGYYAGSKLVDPPLFTQDDQRAIDWVCWPKKKWQAYNKKRKEDMEKIAIEWRERNIKQQKEHEANTRIETANTVINPSTYNMTYTSGSFWKRLERWFGWQ